MYPCSLFILAIALCISIPCPYLAPPPSLSPLITTRLFSISVHLFQFHYIYSFGSFFRFLIQLIIYSICLSLSDLFSLTFYVHPCCCKWQKFHPFVWSCGQVILHYVCILYLLLSIHLLMVT